MLKEICEVMEQGVINRRDFVKIAGTLGIGLATFHTGLPLAEAVPFDRHLYKVSNSRIGMGTIVSITALNPSKNLAEEAIASAYKEIARLTKVMNRFDANTPIAQLNQEGFLKDIPPELSHVLKQSFFYHRIRNGLFDITVKPLLDLFSDTVNGQKKALPDERKISKTLNLVDANLISFHGSTVDFRRDGMGITLDGIAKGYIVDKAAEALIRHGIKHALINAGGDIRTIGDKGDNRPWTIAIEDPLKKKNYPDMVPITDRSIATSGNYEVFFDKEKILHHIINPETGLSPLVNASVSVQAPTAMQADALSTTLFILDPSRGTKLINSFPDCQSFIITKNQQKIKSHGWQGIRT